VCKQPFEVSDKWYKEHTTEEFKEEFPEESNLDNNYLCFDCYVEYEYKKKGLFYLILFSSRDIEVLGKRFDGVTINTKYPKILKSFQKKWRKLKAKLTLEEL
jgi:hypothetical protein